MTLPRGARSVMASRREPPNSLDFFPTPPWGTRAVVEILEEIDWAVRDRSVTVCDPCCGEGHMAHVLADIFGDCVAADVFDYGWGAERADFLAGEWSVGVEVDWFVFNPPFNAAPRFLDLALRRARRGAAMLVRAAFLEGQDRFDELFRSTPPAIVAIFAERLSMVKGRWNPKASSATSYAWLIWRKWSEDDAVRNAPPELRWIPTGTRDRLWMPDDVRRFAPLAPVPLFDGAEP
ncbi:hypothetical protein [Methylopila sp. M107]|uniref:hypothetical protein n=1 Tax=Methylopila sp. M107 TaxID=1101190 RepID=UPI00037DA550|nr:hypothetical protein [Methylopila sp. M107]